MSKQTPAGPGPGKHRPTVLIVEDDLPTLHALAALLAGEGYQVLTAATAARAVEAFRAHAAAVRLVLLDVRLPDAGGLVLARWLRALAPRLPLVVCLGEALPDEMLGLLELGVGRYFRKPVFPDELCATLAALLARGGRARPASPG